MRAFLVSQEGQIITNEGQRLEGARPGRSACTEVPGILPGLATTCCCAAAECPRAPESTLSEGPRDGRARNAAASGIPIGRCAIDRHGAAGLQHAAASAAASEGLRWRNQRPPGGEPANLSRGPVRALASSRLTATAADAIRWRPLAAAPLHELVAMNRTAVCRPAPAPLTHTYCAGSRSQPIALRLAA